MPISNRHARGLPAESCAMTLCTVVTPERRDPFRVPSRSQGARVVTVTSPSPSPCPAGPRVGTTAPDFTLPSTAGSDVTLSSFRGRRHVLLAFFPLAFTSTCTAENCAFSEDYAAFERADTVVLPISVDSVPTLKEYKAKYAMRQDLLSDFKRDVSRAYGTLLVDRFFSTRAYFLVDRQGILRWRHVEAELGARRDDAELLRQAAPATHSDAIWRSAALRAPTAVARAGLCAERSRRAAGNRAHAPASLSRRSTPHRRGRSGGGSARGGHRGQPRAGDGTGGGGARFGVGPRGRRPRAQDAVSPRTRARTRGTGRDRH